MMNNSIIKMTVQTVVMGIGAFIGGKASEKFYVKDNTAKVGKVEEDVIEKEETTEEEKEV